MHSLNDLPEFYFFELGFGSSKGGFRSAIVRVSEGGREGVGECTLVFFKLTIFVKREKCLKKSITV